MAPELSGQKLDYAGPPIDVFALGIILFQMLTCKPLQLEPRDIWWQKFTQDPVEALNEREIELDEEITNLIQRVSSVSYPWWEYPLTQWFTSGHSEFCISDEAARYRDDDHELCETDQFLEGAVDV